MKKSKKSIDAGNLHYLKILGIVIAAILFYAVINNLGKIGNSISFVFGVISPIVIGLCVAFVLNIPLRFFENLVFRRLTKKNGKIWSKLKRPLCLTLSILLILSVLSLLLSFIIPQFVSACTDFFMMLPEQMSNFSEMLRDVVARYNLPIDTAKINIDWEWISAQALQLFSDNSQTITTNTLSIIMGIFSGVFNVVLGFVFSIYILASKEALGRLAKSILYATIKKERAKNVISVVVLSNKAFTGFLAGQCIEVLLIGVLCFLGMLIFGFKYPLMISCIIAITAFVPVFGAVAGAVMGAVLILISDSMLKALLFVVFILVLQQIESNVIYPKIMGKQVGLPGVWVLTAVTIGGGLFSVPGIILSVPLCSVAYTLFQKWIIKRLEERNICHRSISHDSTEPKSLNEELADYDFEPELNTENQSPQEPETDKTNSTPDSVQPEADTDKEIGNE